MTCGIGAAQNFCNQMELLSNVQVGQKLGVASNAFFVSSGNNSSWGGWAIQSVTRVGYGTICGGTGVEAVAGRLRTLAQEICAFCALSDDEINKATLVKYMDKVLANRDNILAAYEKKPQKYETMDEAFKYFNEIYEAHKKEATPKGSPIFSSYV